MWVRNGIQIKGQAMTYIQCHFCYSMGDADLYLMQVRSLSHKENTGTFTVKWWATRNKCINYCWNKHSRKKMVIQDTLCQGADAIVGHNEFYLIWSLCSVWYDKFSLKKKVKYPMTRQWVNGPQSRWVNVLIIWLFSYVPVNLTQITLWKQYWRGKELSVLMIEYI